MVINVARNKRYGPGGSTRRLHHKRTRLTVHHIKVRF